MRIAYFDCFSGVSGNMILGAFLDAGLDCAYLKNQLKKLGLKGYELKIKSIKKSEFPVTEFNVELNNSKGIDHSRKTLAYIQGIINRSSLNDNVKNLSCTIFENLAEAEAKAHGCKKSEIHFHEIGDTDSIIDIAGAAIALDYFKIENVYSSPINIGSGIIKMAHGVLAVPAPVTTVMLKGVPVYSSGEDFELATPTGVAVLKTICDKFGPLPFMKIEKTGGGWGSFNTVKHPNILRVFLGDSSAGNNYETDKMVVVETNIDDMNIVGTEMIFERIFKAGAVDVYFAPVYMKKTRMGILLTAITEMKNLEKVLETIYKETTTFGIRTYEVVRYKLPRSINKTETGYGKTRLKIGVLNNEIITASPEYEDIKKISLEKKLPFRKIYNKVTADFSK